MKFCATKNSVCLFFKMHVYLRQEISLFSDFIADTAQRTGILLDNCYTGKAAYGMSDLLRNKADVFRGKRIMFLHSGMLMQKAYHYCIMVILHILFMSDGQLLML